MADLVGERAKGNLDELPAHLERSAQQRRRSLDLLSQRLDGVTENRDASPSGDTGGSFTKTKRTTTPPPGVAATAKQFRRRSLGGGDRNELAQLGSLASGGASPPFGSLSGRAGRDEPADVSPGPSVPPPPSHGGRRRSFAGAPALAPPRV
jgi:hypothetical protein